MAKAPPETREVQLLSWILEEIKRGCESSRCVCPLLREILSELQSINEKIDQLLPQPANPTDKIAIVFGGNMSATPGTVVVGSNVVASIVPLEADGVTVTPGAVVSAQGYAIDNPALATFVVNPDGTATFTGVAPGTANVTATATVTDVGGTGVSFTTTNTLTVTPIPPPPAVTASIQLNFK